jgi:hypothetical protein
MQQDQPIITEPSIGQKNYLSSLQKGRQDKQVAYMFFEMELPEVNEEALDKTISFFIQRHESLRTVFQPVTGSIKQVVLPYQKEKYSITHIVVESDDRLAQLRNENYRQASRQFARIDEGPLVKTFLFKKPANRYLFSFLIHHVLCDAWSEKIVERELMAIYRSYVTGSAPSLPPLTVQLRDYCTRLNAQVQENANSTGAYWQNKLTGYTGLLQLEAFHIKYQQRHGSPAGGMLPYSNRDELSALLQQQRSAMYTSLIDTAHFIKIKDLARSSHCGISAIVYASFYIFFYLYPGKARLLFAILMADRDTREKQSIIGSLLGAIYMPATVSGEQRVMALVKETFLQVLEAGQHVIYDHETIKLNGRELWLNCDLYLNYMTVNKEMLATGFYRKDHTEDENIFYALNCMLIEYSDGLCINWRYNTALFTRELIEDMARCHEVIVNYITKHPACTVNEIKDHFSAGVQTGSTF